MGIIIDIVILAIVALFTFIGYKKGLIKCAVSALTFLIAILVVILLTTPVSNLIIKNTKIDDNIKTTIAEKLDFSNTSSDKIKLDEENSNSPEVVRDYINDMIKDIKKDTTKSVEDALAENIAVMIINVAVAICLFFLTKFALMFVKVLADVVGKIPLIKQFNKAGGIIYGIINGIVKIYLIFAIISIIVPLLTEASLVDAINQSMIGNIMYNDNIILKIILL